MSYSIKPWIVQLKAARRRKGLNQAELGVKVGLPQSHISRIESGSIDIRLSSLLELARALDLEPMLIPRKLVPAVQSLTQHKTTVQPKSGEHRLVGHAPKAYVRPAYALDEDDSDG
jgi:transcriptional regulator with XRE-family HTH domain